MAKKSLAEKYEDAIRKVISSHPDTMKAGETEYCEALIEACEMVAAGPKERLLELENEALEDSDEE